tara:strand:+ start:316 stop:624 length:309 start_codon:yes stop_codon:yes gene_type:complete
LHTEVKHHLSGSLIYTDAPKDHDGNGKDFAPTDLLASALGSCVITIMGIEAKRIGWELGEVTIDVYKIMTSKGPRKIKSLCLEIFMQSDINHQKLKVLQITA